MKYVIVERAIPKGKAKPEFMPKYPILFADHLVHESVVPEGYVAVSAGDIGLDGKKPKCSGKSESLGLTSDPAADEYLIRVWLTTGESMLIMASESYDAMRELK
jgi:hypothetical protein